MKGNILSCIKLDMFKHNSVLQSLKEQFVNAKKEEKNSNKAVNKLSNPKSSNTKSVNNNNTDKTISKTIPSTETNNPNSSNIHSNNKEHASKQNNEWKNALKVHTDEPLHTGELRIHPKGFGFIDKTRNTYFVNRIYCGKVLNGTTVTYFTSINDNGKHAHIVNLDNSHYMRTATITSITPLLVKFDGDIDRQFKARYFRKQIKHNLQIGSVFKVEVHNLEQINQLNKTQPEFILTEFVGKETDRFIRWKKSLAYNGLLNNKEAEFTPIDGFCSQYPYVDLTDIKFVSIDSETTQDIDDLVYVKELDIQELNNLPHVDKPTSVDYIFDADVDVEQLVKFELGATSVILPRNAKYLNLTAIADPSYYFNLDSDVLSQARELTSTVFLPEYTVKMLNEELTINYGSLLPNTNRPALVFIQAFDSKGKFLSSRIIFAQVRNSHKLSYQSVHEYLEDKEKTLSRFPEIEPTQELLDSLINFFKVRQQWRKDNNLFFANNNNVQDFVIDEEGNCTDIKLKPAYLSNELITELMLLVNCVTGKFFVQNQIPGVFLGQNGCKVTTVPSFITFLKYLAETTGDQEIRELSDSSVEEFANIETFSKIRTLISNHNEFYVDIANRLMQASYYSAQPVAHYGLGENHYLTISSPLRRYADLLNQINLKAFLTQQNGLVVDQALADHLNAKRLSIRSSIKELQSYCEGSFLKQNPNAVYDAHVINVLHNGIRIRLVESGINGFIHVGRLNEESLPENYEELETDTPNGENNVMTHVDTINFSIHNDFVKLAVGDLIQVQLLNIYQDKITFRRLFTQEELSK